MSKPRFNAYREITAKFDSQGSCGHPIKKGDQIGYARQGRTSFTQCPECWDKWVAENRYADAVEAGYTNSCW